MINAVPLDAPPLFRPTVSVAMSAMSSCSSSTAGNGNDPGVQVDEATVFVPIAVPR